MALRGRALLESEALFKLKAKPGEGMCPVAQCRHKSKTGPGCVAGLCPTHVSQRFRRDKKVASAFNSLRNHAKDRGIPFEISLPYLEGLMDQYGYQAALLSAAGQKDKPSFDRVDPAKGYVRSNVRIVTISENSAKGRREMFLPATVRAILARKKAQMQAKLDTHDEWQERTGDPF